MKSRLLAPRGLVALALACSLMFVVAFFSRPLQAPTSSRPTQPAQIISLATATPLPPFSPSLPQTPPRPVEQGTLFFSAERGGRWEIYAAKMNAAGKVPFTAWKQLTRGYSPARAPALSPDGSRLAFQSRKDGNWEIYVLDLLSGQITRLTHDLAYDGAPTWSPDGSQIAFESYRAGDLDIWRMNADGTALLNLTADEPSYDFAPTWSPDGQTIAFVSWRTGNKQLYGMSPDGRRVVNLSQNRFHDEQPAWSPDGKRLAFVSNREGCAEHITASVENPPLPGSVAAGNCQRRNIYVADFDGMKLSNVRQVTFMGRDLAPAWSPDNQALAFVSPRPSRQPIFAVNLDDDAPRALNDETGVWVGTVIWSSLPELRVGVTPIQEPPLYQEAPIPASPAEAKPYKFRAMREVYLAPSWGLLASTVASSYLALRQRVLEESGLDFLGTLSDMTRLISSRCDHTCDDLSWHKSGRAVDTLLTLPVNGQNAVVLVREDVLSEVYWRLYLRAAKQDGSMGEPLKEAPWDLSARARSVIAPGQGGMEGPIEYGYFVDFTELARHYGWNRISAHDDPEFDWRNNREALEFWHFQKEDGLNWWEAMQQVYAPDELAENFDWNTIVSEWDTEPSRVFLKNVPPPPSAWKWFVLVPR